jgi:transcription elongation factor Elf1
MAIRFKCPHCQKALSVKDHLAGKKAACPVCKKAIAIPVSAPADVDALAAEAFTDKPAEKPAETEIKKDIVFPCPFCDEEIKVSADVGGKKTPCPHCSKVVKVPLPQDSKPKDWRTIQKSGPSAAMANLPEQLSDAWGTEQKGRVSRAAMEEAGALPEPKAKSVGVVGWIKRGVWVVVIGGAGFFLLNMAIKSREAKREKVSLEEVKQLMVSSKWDPVQQADYFLVAGEIDVGNRRATEAQTNFFLARSQLLDPAKDKNPLESDLLLVKLALAQAEMGGSGKETLISERSQERFDWAAGTVQKDLLQTLQAIRTEEARATAFRELSSKFLDMDKPEIPMGLAANLASLKPGQVSPAVAHLKALKLARQDERKDDDSVAQIAAPPTDPNQDLLDTLTRLAYTEGFAFKRDYAQAHKIANWKGPNAARVEACVAGATMALLDTKNKDADIEAAKFITEARTAYQDLVKEKKEKLSDWTLLELIRIGSRTSVGDSMKELVDQLDPNLKPRAQLDFFHGQLARNSGKVYETARVEEIGEDKSQIRGFAWQALARHNSRLNTPVQNADDSIRPFALLGNALGEQDSRK